MSLLNDGAQVLVVGAGVAGVSAALWLDDFDIPFCWIDAAGEVGGMLRRVHNRIDNVPGKFYDDGMSLCRALQSQLDEAQLRFEHARLTRIRRNDSGLTAIVDGTAHRFERIILATGTRYRRLDVPGEDEGMGRWISQSATADAARFSGTRVAVVGGGDAGFENALRLADHDCRVTLLLRSPPCARPSFADAVDAHPSIDIAPIPSQVRRIERLDEGCRLHLDQCGDATTIEVAALFVRIGVDPVVPDYELPLETDERGFLVADEYGRTSCVEIFAAGDVTSIALRSVATATGSGAMAARACGVDLGCL